MPRKRTLQWAASSSLVLTVILLAIGAFTQIAWILWLGLIASIAFLALWAASWRRGVGMPQDQPPQNLFEDTKD